MSLEKLSLTLRNPMPYTSSSESRSLFLRSECLVVTTEYMVAEPATHRESYGRYHGSLRSGTDAWRI